MKQVLAFMWVLLQPLPKHSCRPFVYADRNGLFETATNII